MKSPYSFMFNITFYQKVILKKSLKALQNKAFLAIIQNFTEKFKYEYYLSLVFNRKGNIRIFVVYKCKISRYN